MIRFVIAGHSPVSFAKTDLPSAARENGYKFLIIYMGRRFLWSGFEGQYRNLRAKFLPLVEYRLRFLCTGDCLVALPGIEPGFED